MYSFLQAQVHYKDIYLLISPASTCIFLFLYLIIVIPLDKPLQYGMLKYHYEKKIKKEGKVDHPPIITITWFEDTL